MVGRHFEGGGPEEPGEPGSKGQQGEGIYRYRMRQNLVAFGDDYRIENALGSRVFFVDGKLTAYGSTWVLRTYRAKNWPRSRKR